MGERSGLIVSIPSAVEAKQLDVRDLRLDYPRCRHNLTPITQLALFMRWTEQSDTLVKAIRLTIDVSSIAASFGDDAEIGPARTAIESSES
jgi:hypothetical protein